MDELVGRMLRVLGMSGVQFVVFGVSCGIGGCLAAGMGWTGAWLIGGDRPSWVVAAALTVVIAVAIGDQVVGRKLAAAEEAASGD